MELPSVLGDIGTAGFGVELEQSLPILDGGFKPEGFGKADGLTALEVLGVVTLLDVEELIDVDVGVIPEAPAAV